ncbi:MAG: alpha-D-ribose 1-methylphosphonate 5-triphosphate diphosphatase, partial [Deltaproteobacteria bacterium]|nr:alpha-D-ribose 1-methylphosphonate 5-triphosphate diphosphatase [Deltaproteobacteria bacterium]
DHRSHLRCEVPDESAWELFQELAPQPPVRLVSLNDHTPHQRQWTNIEAFKRYHGDKNWSAQDLEELIAEKLRIQRRVAPVNRHRIARFCQARNLPLATHDDTIPEHVVQAKAEGATISEFPTTLEAAQEARVRGMVIVAGAPNVVQRGSHSNNVSVRDLAEKGLLDVLSSDYVPGSLIHAVFILHQDLGLGLAQAAAMATVNPAQMVGLDDRGSLKPGNLADLIRVRLINDLPVVIGVWRAGVKVF